MDKPMIMKWKHSMYTQTQVVPNKLNYNAIGFHKKKQGNLLSANKSAEALKIYFLNLYLFIVELNYVW